MSGERWPMQYAGITLLPPLVYCPTHRKWEGYDDSIVGLCDYCCLESPCPLGHDPSLLDEAWGRYMDEDGRIVTDPPPRERDTRYRHKTGGAEPANEDLDIPYLDWS